MGETYLIVNHVFIGGKPGTLTLASTGLVWKENVDKGSKIRLEFHKIIAQSSSENGSEVELHIFLIDGRNLALSFKNPSTPVACYQDRQAVGNVLARFTGGGEGCSLGFIHDLKTNTDSSNQININHNSIRSIFKIFPKVFDLYKSIVPLKMRSSDFWTLFFKSHYIQKDVESSDERNIFTKMGEREDELDFSSAIAKMAEGERYFDSHTAQDLAEELRSKIDQYSPNCSQLLRRINHQSILVLKTNKRPLEEESINESSKKLRQIQKELYEEPEIKLNGVRCQIDPRPYQNMARAKEINHEEIQWRNSFLKSETRLFLRPKREFCPEILSKENAILAFNDIIVNSRPKDEGVPSASGHELKTVVDACRFTRKLLRDFWSCFPVNTPQKKSEILNAKNALELFKHNQLNALRNNFIKHKYDTNSLDNLFAQIESALRKFSTLKLKIGPSK